MTDAAEHGSPISRFWRTIASPKGIAIVFALSLLAGAAVKIISPPMPQDPPGPATPAAQGDAADGGAAALSPPEGVPGESAPDAASAVEAPPALGGPSIAEPAELPGPLLALLEAIGFVAGLILLVVGADYLVRGAVRLARGFGVSPFLIGVTVVAFGTSAPELVASITATLKQQGDIAIGNVIGSNIANLCLILGATAVVRPIAVDTSVVKVDLPLMIAITVVAPIVMLDSWYLTDPPGEPGIVAFIGRIDGLILTVGLIGYIIYNTIAGKLDPLEIEQDLEVDAHRPEPATPAGAAAPARPGAAVPATAAADEAETKAPASASREGGPGGRWSGLLGNVALIVFGLVGLVLGGDLLVDGSTRIAGRLGVPPVVIGLTIVAIGTSLPELALSVRAAMHGHSDIAVGNVIGSNVFNLLCVLGIAGLIDPIKVPVEAIHRDIWFMLIVTLFVWPLFWSRSRLSRREGVLLLLMFGIYLVLVSLWGDILRAIGVGA